MTEQIIIFFQIVFIDLVLAGDNAIIIGMVASQFKDKIRKKIIFWGIGAAIVLRIIFTLITAYLLQINGLKTIGGLLLLYIAYKLYKDVIKNGISDDRFIIYGDNIKRTLDEAVEFKKFLENYDMKDILLVTSELHMRRAYKLFNAKGIELDRYSVEVMDNSIKKIVNIKNFIPNQDGIKMTKNILYELFGYIGYWLKGNL